ncbi:MAG: hypothetical protein GJ677_08890 [Rhodobacteraceae bacterium]|nr:hypothetical protein [Paracoccaceae bacterium]
MAVTRFRFLLLIFMTLIAVGQAEAWSCGEPDVVFLENRENAPTEAEVLRHRSIAIAARLLDTLVDGEKIVVGRFKRNEPAPLLHEDQLDQIRAMYWPPSKDVKMPYSIEYTYFGVYSFTGHELVGATLVPFATSAIDAQVSISAEYEGIVMFCRQLKAT